MQYDIAFKFHVAAKCNDVQRQSASIIDDSYIYIEGLSPSEGLFLEVLA